MQLAARSGLWGGCAEPVDTCVFAEEFAEASPKGSVDLFLQRLVSLDAFLSDLVK